jgi:hypothetical protein
MDEIKFKLPSDLKKRIGKVATKLALPVASVIRLAIVEFVSKCERSK